MKKYLYVTFGLPGSGKSTVAVYMMGRIGSDAVHISADGIRKELFLVPEYSKMASRKVWETCIARATHAMKAGKIIVWDAVFGHEHRRQEVRDMAREHGYEAQFIYVFCESDASIEHRLDTRKNDLSDADYSVYCGLKDFFQHPASGTTLCINNSSDLESLYNQVDDQFFSPHPQPLSFGGEGRT